MDWSPSNSLSSSREMLEDMFRSFVSSLSLYVIFSQIEREGAVSKMIVRSTNMESSNKRNQMIWWHVDSRVAVSKVFQIENVEYLVKQIDWYRYRMMIMIDYL